jgi:hypothetical protein
LEEFRGADRFALGTPERMACKWDPHRYAENDAVYQQVGRGFVMHARNDLDAVPAIGGTYRIEHGANKATVAPVSARRRLARRI